MMDGSVSLILVDPAGAAEDSGDVVVVDPAGVVEETGDVVVDPAGVVEESGDVVAGPVGVDEGSGAVVADPVGVAVSPQPVQAITITVPRTLRLSCCMVHQHFLPEPACGAEILVGIVKQTRRVVKRRLDGFLPVLARIVPGCSLDSHGASAIFNHPRCS
jgi:hypothetical protein